MNQNSEMTEEFRNPWKNFTEISKPEPMASTLQLLLYLISCTVIPLGFFHPLIAVCGWILLTVGGFYVTRRKNTGAKLLIAETVLAAILPLLFVSTNTSSALPALGSLAAALTVGLMAGTFFQTVTRQFWALILATAVAGGIVYLVTKSWILALSCAALLLPVLLLSVATNMGKGCTTAICFALGGFLLTLGIGFCIYTFAKTGSLAPSAFNSIVDGWQKAMIDSQISKRELLLKQIADVKAAEPDLSADVLKVLEQLELAINTSYTDASINNMAVSALELLPALAVIFFAVPSYVGQMMLNASYTTWGMRQVVTPESECFTMSLASAIVYFISSFAMLFVPNSLNLFSMIVTNLCLILTPGFLVVGVWSFRKQFAPILAKSKGLLIILLLAGICCLNMNLLILIALWGAYSRVAMSLRQKMEQKFDENGQQ